MPLNRRQIIELAYAMQERRSVLLEEVRRGVTRAREEQYASIAGTTPDVADEALAGLIVDLDQAEMTRDLAEVRALDAALQRIVDGSYGLCLDCGIEIPVERLRAQPAASRCISCQQRHEKTYRT